MLRKEFIKYKNKILVLILRNGDFPKDLNFHTKDEDFIQLATWRYQKGKRTAPHSHKIAQRLANRTQEVLFIKKGKIKAEIFTDQGKFLKKKFLNTGDIVIFLGGGHAFEILKDKTQVLEVKNGPYLGLEKDKRVIKQK